MNCPNCNSTLEDGTYICSTNDYRIIASNENLIIIIETHSIDDSDDEIGDSQSVKYCTCGYWSF